MPIPLGILAAAGAGGGGGGGATYQLIQTVTSSGSSFSLGFTNIPQTFKHLQVRYVAKTTAGTGSGFDGLAIEVNPYGSGSFSTHALTGNGSSVTSSAGTNQNFIVLNNAVTTNVTANAFSAAVIDVLDYSSTTKFKTWRVLQGHAANNNFIQLHSGRSGSTNAVTDFALTLFAGNFAAGTRVSLYGIA